MFSSFQFGFGCRESCRGKHLTVRPVRRRKIYVWKWSAIFVSFILEWILFFSNWICASLDVSVSVSMCVYTFSECQTPFKVSRECVSTTFSIDVRVHENGSEKKKEHQTLDISFILCHIVGACIVLPSDVSKFIRSKCASGLRCGKGRRYKSYKYIIMFHSIVARSQCETDNSVFITHATRGIWHTYSAHPGSDYTQIDIEDERHKQQKKRTTKKKEHRIKWRQHCRPAISRVDAINQN